jgi:broad specificity phosphatase PhoE
MPPERILLIRHGETDWNAEERWQGFAPTELNALGHRQAAVLADYLAQRPIAAIYSSDLPRTWQTAVPLARVLGLEPQPDPRWREINLGVFQGLTIAEMEQQYPDEVLARKADLWGYVYPQGESRRDLANRARAAWEQVVANASGKEVAVISHGGTIRSLLWDLFGEDGDEKLHQPITNTSITTIEVAAGQYVLHTVGETPHLANAQIRPDGA